MRASAEKTIVLSPDSVKSRWCRGELDQALTREKRTGQKIVLPLLYRRVKAPPFLEGRLFLNFNENYWRSLALLTAFLHGIDQHSVIERFREFKPREVAGVLKVLRGCGRSKKLTLSENDYGNLMRIFRKADIEIPKDRVRLMMPGMGEGTIFVDEICENTAVNMNHRLFLRDKTKSSFPSAGESSKRSDENGAFNRCKKPSGKRLSEQVAFRRKKPPS